MAKKMKAIRKVTPGKGLEICWIEGFWSMEIWIMIRIHSVQ